MAEAAPAPAQPTPQVAPVQADQKAEDKQPAKVEAPKVGEKRGSQLLSEDQRKALEKQILQRPDVEALRAHGIMKEGGRLAAAQAKLQRELKSDALSRGLDQRPSQDDLIASHIVEDRPVAPSLAAVARKLERNILANTLNQKLYTRTDVDALKQQGLLKSDNVAPRLRNAKVRLEHAITRDQLGHLLETRPAHEDLLRSGIIKPAPALSNKIAGVQRQLQHNMRVDKVGQLLEKRSEVDNLQHRGVLPDMRIATNIQGPQRALERSLARSNLYHALKHRPSLNELQERGVYVGDPYNYAAQQQNGLYPPEEGEGDDDEHQQLPLEEQQGGMEYILAQRQSLSMGQGGILNSGAPGSGGMQAETKQSYQQQQQAAAEPSGYQRRSKNFHLTRILLKCVANMAEAGEISLQAKGYLKDLIVDQDKTILAVAETFDSENDINDFKESLITLASRQK